MTDGLITSFSVQELVASNDQGFHLGEEHIVDRSVSLCIMFSSGCCNGNRLFSEAKLAPLP